MWRRTEWCSGLFQTWNGRTSLLLPSACNYRFSEFFVWMPCWKAKRQESFLSSHCWHDTTNVHVSSIPEKKTFEVYWNAWKHPWTWLLNTSKLQLLCVYVCLFTYECIYKYYQKEVKSAIQLPFLANGIFLLVLILSKIKSKLSKVLQPELWGGGLSQRLHLGMLAKALLNKDFHSSAGVEGRTL